MNIDEVKAERKRLQQQILDAVNHFEELTGMQVTGVNLQAEYRFGDLRKGTILVDVEVKL